MTTADADPRIKGWVQSNVSYLEMRAPPDRPPTVAARDGVEVRRAVRPTVSFYRYLYDTVGGEWTWAGRRLMDDEALSATIGDPRVEVNVLWVEGVPAGLMELGRRSPFEIELLYFGLIPDFIGKGHGRFALDWAVDRAWSHRPSRFWVHTCDLDHPNALSVYQKAGFVIYDRQRNWEAVLHGMTPPRRNGVAVPDSEIASSPNSN
ncbi:MAG: GNAT family N-acetyltransferase [Alphaproteobacteria bacterium]|nr:GNAT family N-acetyltransferase [Alphaproteobacteria bacterium]